MLPELTAYRLLVDGAHAVALVAVVLEVAWVARRRRAVLLDAATGAGLLAGAALVGLAHTVVLRAAWDLLAPLRLGPAVALWEAAPVLGAVAAFVAWDAAGWLYHAIGHRTAAGWAAHRVHHSGADYDLTLGLRQTWFPFHALLVHPLLAVAGFDLRVVAACAALSSCWQLLLHTSAPLRLPRVVEAVVMTPASHRQHHGLDAGAVNLGPVLTVWDRWAGTWVAPSAPAPTAYGLGDAPSRNPVELELAGWRALVQSRERLATTT